MAALTIIAVIVVLFFVYMVFGNSCNRSMRYYQNNQNKQIPRYTRFNSGVKINQTESEGCFNKYGKMLQTLEHMSETRDMYMGFAENLAANLDRPAEKEILKQLNEFDKSLLKAKRSVCSEIELGNCCGPLSEYYRNYRSSWLPVCSNCSSNNSHVEKTKKKLGNTLNDYKLALSKLQGLINAANERSDVGGDAHNTLTLRPGEETPSGVKGGFEEDQNEAWEVLSDKKWHFRSPPRRVFSFTEQ